jgi:hypothetical protein
VRLEKRRGRQECCQSMAVGAEQVHEAGTAHLESPAVPVGQHGKPWSAQTVREPQQLHQHAP